MCVIKSKMCPEHKVHNKQYKFIIRVLASVNEWGGEPEILLASKTYKLHVVLYSDELNFQRRIYGEEYDNVVYLVLRNNHYEPAFPRYPDDSEMFECENPNVDLDVTFEAGDGKVVSKHTVDLTMKDEVLDDLVEDLNVTFETVDDKIVSKQIVDPTVGEEVSIRGRLDKVYGLYFDETEYMDFADAASKRDNSDNSIVSLEDRTCSPVIEDILSKVNTDVNTSVKALSDETIIKDEVDSSVPLNNSNVKCGDKLNSTQICDNSTVVICDVFNNISEIVHNVTVDNDVKSVTSQSLVLSDHDSVVVTNDLKEVTASTENFIQGGVL